jgi:hypothetical protein
MKNVLLITLISFCGMAALAQNYENIRNMALLQNYEKAKTDLDKAWANAKFISKPEAYMLKAFVYSSLAMDPKTKNTPQAEQLLNEADAAFRKYKELDPAQPLLNDQVYQGGPINLYSGYYSSGYNDYADKKWEPASKKMKKAVEYSDLLIEKKLLNSSIDTNVLILAGITAENHGLKDEAAIYYGRLADKKLSGDGFESVYRFLVSHNFQKKDYAAFEKYKSTGAELYPKSEYFTFDKIDFAIGLETEFSAKLKAMEEMLATDPNNFKANEIIGEIIYDTLNPSQQDAPLPSNAEELEKKMIAAFHKAAAAKPGFENPFLYLGDHFINKAAKVGEQREAHAAQMKSRTKPGVPASKEDIAKRDALDKTYGEALELARDPYEKAAQIYASKAKLEQREKLQYKKAVSYLADIAAYKKASANKAKNTVDAARYTAEEKKWLDLWDSLK